jgi:hypothetical protein
LTCADEVIGSRNVNDYRPHQDRGRLAPHDGLAVIPLPPARIERRQAVAGLINEYRGADWPLT